MKSEHPRGRAVLVTGGARSGKSRFAEQLAEQQVGGRDVVYIATSQVYDEEMRERVEKHRQRRNPCWRTIEEPYELQAVLSRLATDEQVGLVLVDCLTLWLTNMLLVQDQSGHEQWTNPAYQAHIFEQVAALAAQLQTLPYTTILVTNEVGASLVPEYPLGRVFRDMAGQVNQRLAAVSEQVYWVVCGMAVDVRQLAVSTGSRMP